MINPGKETQLQGKVEHQVLVICQVIAFGLATMSIGFFFCFKGKIMLLSGLNYRVDAISDYR